MNASHSQLLNSRYALGEMIGSGGMADVYEGMDTRLDRKVAIKILRRDLASDETFIQRFQKEALAAAALTHEGIVSIFDAQTDGNDHYIVMELVNGTTLRKYLTEHAPLSEVKALDICSQVLEALKYSHAHGVVHRDIKPGNIMITEIGKVKVTDFGIARRTDDVSVTMTNTWNVVGTAQYLAPEQALGEEVDGRSDIYAVGALLYEMLTNKPLFTGETPISIAYQHVSNPHPRLSANNPELDADLDNILDKALAKQKEDRYQNAENFLHDIARVAAGVKVTPLSRTVVKDRNAAALFGLSERKKFLSWFGVAILVIGGLSTSLLILQNNNKKYQVQNVLGETLSQAKNALSHFSIVVVNQPNSSTPKGRVAVQNPLPLAHAKRGSVITLTISQGPGTTTVPHDLIGLTLDQARAEIASAGLILSSTTPVTSSQDPGTVLSSTPAPGAAIKAGSSISLQIASGIAVVPNLVGLDKIEAETLLTQDGFLISTIPGIDENQFTGVVLAQSPGVGSSVSIGSLVTITINTGGNAAPATTNSAN
jgi:serine/threonine-protein kinase